MPAQCKLCLKERKLSKSHIVPEFLHAPIYDDAGKGLAVTSQGNRFGVTSGFTEHLLCENCEQLLSGYEGYAADVSRKILDIEDEQEIATLEDVDYDQFKLFQLSLLWRLGITNNPAYEGVSLGTKHEERLRQMIIQGDPGKSYEYGCIVGVKQNPRLRGIIGIFGNFKIEGHQFYRIATGGIDWGFFVSSHTEKLSHTYTKYFPKPNEPLLVLNQPDRLAEAELRYLSKELIRVFGPAEEPSS